MVKVSPTFLILVFVLFLFVSSETQAATITVTTADDVMSTDGQCSLREAIIRANTDPVGLIVLGECDLGSGDDEIRFDPSLNGIPIELSIAGSGEDASGTGDLDIVSNITIRGNGVDNTVIDANSIDRVFHIIGVSRQVTMLDISITGGLLNDVPGSGISNAGTLLLVRVSSHTIVVTGTTSSAIGGGIFNSGTLAIFESTIDNNTADRGSGIFSNNLVEIFGSTISNNTGRAGVGVINFGGLGIFNSTISKNNASN
ncbi:MAG: CSLREA domain-containing protein, partial [Thermodesulfobacteriota bacterium]